MNIQDLIKECAETTKEKGFDVSQHVTQHLLFASEVMEALEHVSWSGDKGIDNVTNEFFDLMYRLEGLRCELGGHDDVSYITDPIHHLKELAGLQIRLFSYIGGNGMTEEFLSYLRSEMDYNKTRPYKHGKRF